MTFLCPIFKIWKAIVGFAEEANNWFIGFKYSHNKCYRWEKNLRQNKDIKVLLSIDPTSFPLGTGTKAHEIWHSDDNPVV